MSWDSFPSYGGENPHSMSHRTDGFFFDASPATPASIVGQKMQAWASEFGPGWQQALKAWGSIPTPIIWSEGDQPTIDTSSHNQSEVTAEVRIIIEKGQNYNQHDLLFVKSEVSQNSADYQKGIATNLVPVVPLSFVEMLRQFEINSYARDAQPRPIDQPVTHRSFSRINYPSTAYLWTWQNDDGTLKTLNVEPKLILHLDRSEAVLTGKKPMYDNHTPLIHGPSASSANLAMSAMIDTFHPVGYFFQPINSVFDHFNPTVIANFAVSKLCDVADIWRTSLKEGTRLFLVMSLMPAYGRNDVAFNHDEHYFCRLRSELHGQQHDVRRRGMSWQQAVLENTYHARMTITPFARADLEHPFQWVDFNSVFRPDPSFPVAILDCGRVAAINALHNNVCQGNMPYKTDGLRRHFGVPIPSIVNTESRPGRVIASNNIIGEQKAGTLDILRVDTPVLSWQFFPATNF